MREMARMRNWIPVLIMVMALAGSAFGLDRAAATGDKPEKADKARSKDEISITGTVVHVDLEGGFWGVVGDDGKQYDVPNLPKEFRKHGLRVKFAARLSPGQISFHMWGVIVEVVSIEKIGEMSK
ncbi:MAG: hypothetical protein HYS23_00510 [Geobacter sp.]|nr:hypothetical protein [Geobacter sp.]